MGSVFSTKQSAPPSPPPPPPSPAIRDEISGVEQVPVKNDDGSTTYITRRIPLTADQQAQEKEYQRIIDESLKEISQLSSSDYSHDEDIQKILNSWEDTRQKVSDDSFDMREAYEEKSLARRGLGDSTASQAVRRQRMLDEQESESQIDRDKDILSSDIRREQLALQQNLFNMASNRQDLNATKALSGASSAQRSYSAYDAANRASISDYYNRQVQQSNSSSSGGQTGGLFGSVMNIGGGLLNIGKTLF